ncbi:MAG: nucleoside monophosphate kinase [Nanoarchaeota archaeon]|nr:nucleoside monophosphate kinase [Nanoarchaeota archaeon]
MEKYKGILFVGPPGSGKGTQGKILEKKGNYFHFSTGDMFRNLDKSTELGARVKALIDRGNFVDDFTTIILAKETLRNYISNNQFQPLSQYLILDGLPRNASQVSMVTEFVTVCQVLYFDIPDNIIVDRLWKRAMKEGRADDADSGKIKKRLDIYSQTTEPLLKEYPAHLIYPIFSDQPIEEVVTQIWDLIKK